MRRLITTFTATGAAVIALASASPVLAAYGGPANGSAGAGNLPAASADAPAQSPLVPLGTLGAGLLLVGAAGVAMIRRRGLNR